MRRKKDSSLQSRRETPFYHLVHLLLSVLNEKLAKLGLWQSGVKDGQDAAHGLTTPVKKDGNKVISSGLQRKRGLQQALRAKEGLRPSTNHYWLIN